MNLRGYLRSVGRQENLNFLLTNRIPRAAATRFMARFAKVRVPWVRDISITTMQTFTELSLDDAVKTEFDSLHDCFIRELKPGARPIAPDPSLLTSPCDAIVGACGSVHGDELLQIKGSTYTLQDLLGSARTRDRFRDGSYITLRLTAGMYHRFHAPADCHVDHVTYVSGDTWNTNPIALQRVEKLFCKNERVVLQGTVDRTGSPFALVAVASILVASVRLHFLDLLLHLNHKGPNEIPCQQAFAKGQEMGWFELGSTIVLLVPPGHALAEGIRDGVHVRMGQPLLRLPNA